MVQVSPVLSTCAGSHGLGFGTFIGISLTGNPPPQIGKAQLSRVKSEEELERMRQVLWNGEAILAGAHHTEDAKQNARVRAGFDSSSCTK